MKCRHKESMDYFYLTKENVDDFLKIFFNEYIDYNIINKDENCLTMSIFNKQLNTWSYGQFYFNLYYVFNGDIWMGYIKEIFEEKFEVID